jgi:hypothetical protein
MAASYRWTDCFSNEILSAAIAGGIHPSEGRWEYKNR